MQNIYFSLDCYVDERLIELSKKFSNEFEKRTVDFDIGKSLPFFIVRESEIRNSYQNGKVSADKV